MRKLIVGAVATASIVGGAVGIAAVSPLGLAGAQNTPGTSVPAPAPSPPGPSTGAPNAKPGMPGRRGSGANPLSDTLKELVANGTITQAQADAITAKMKSKIGQGHADEGGRGFAMFKEFGQTAADAIGIDVKTLMAELKGGKSLADVAKAHNVDPQKVIDALVAKAGAQIDKAVADGKLTADKAAAAKAKLSARVTAMVNRSFTGPSGHGPGSREGAGPDTNSTDPTTAPPATAAPTTTAPVTTAPSTTAPLSPGTTTH